ncbi:S8 family serine peptidase [Blastococcus sp. BMG 814]|uniref:S8 family serine peptidase n=1 Tax=Blastococcus carthaginiensis TaxID=3050034 RepID=A0ABT9I7R3_9ACTN|nr:S8 family serine peptidase [Blastococcus carthaginiensis]MDP5181598.1 S8 family serine peptidase [Blastococcus carthaginiensis]
MPTYTVLRDLAAARTGEPYGGTTEGPEAPGLGTAGLRIDVERLEKSEVRALARDPEVRAIAPIMPTRLIRPVDVEGDEPRAGGSATWGVTAVGADRSTRTGAGVTVAVLDTGIDATHPAFSGVHIVQRDFSGSGDGDKDGHGTHCAGTILGRDVDGVRIGVAPGVPTALIGKVLGDDGSGDSDMIFRGIQWAVDGGAHVISMSLGFDFPGLVEQLVARGWPADLATSLALEAYRANLRMFDALMGVVRSRQAFGPGTLLVAAAGNESKRHENPEHEIAVSIPAAAEGVISVGALGESADGLRVAPFSNTFPQISGPGVMVRSAKAGGGLATLSGTSMATPHVAGVAALWWEDVAALPVPLSALPVTARLLATATTEGIASDVDVADRGAGLVQAP